MKGCATHYCIDRIFLISHVHIAQLFPEWYKGGGGSNLNLKEKFLRSSLLGLSL